MAESKYNESFPERAMDLASDGLTDSQIAYRLGVSRSSFYNYKRQYPELVEAIESGRDVVDGKVENSLLRQALGDYTITTHVTDHEGRTRTTVKDAVASLKAIVIWLERSDRRKGIKAPPCGSRDCGIDKREKLEEKTEQPKVEIQTEPIVPPAPELDPSEIGGLQALAEYKAEYILILL